MRKLVAGVFLVIAITQLGVRIVRHRDSVPFWDFSSVYSASRTWIDGGDPYDIAQVRGTWRKLTGSEGADDDVDHWQAVYPPPSLAMLAPIAAFPPTAAIAVWLSVLLGLLGLQLAALLSLAGLTAPWARADGRAALLICGSLAAAPLQFGILAAQPSLPAISLTILAAWCAAKSREPGESSSPRRQRFLTWTAGLLLGLACAFKPHVAFLFLVYFVVKRRWRIAGIACAIAVSISLLAVLAMQHTDARWLKHWSANIALTQAAGQVNDRSPNGPYRDEIVDLQVLIQNLWQHPFTASLISAGVGVLLVGWYAWSLRSKSNAECGTEHGTYSEVLLPLATIGALSLLPLYHRVYDAAILTPAFAWALCQLEGNARAKRLGWIALASLSVFLIPFDLLSSITYRSTLARSLGSSWWWHTLVVPHYAWGALIVTLILLWALRQQRWRRA